MKFAKCRFAKSMTIALLGCSLVLAGCGGKKAHHPHARPSTSLSVPEPTGATGVTQSLPPGALGDADLLKVIAECRSGSCKLLSRKDGFPSSDGTATFALVQLSQAGFGGPDRLYVVSNSAKLVWSAPTEAVNDVTMDTRGIVTDASGNALLALAVGAHSGFVAAIRITPGGVQDLGDLPGAVNGKGPFFGSAGAGVGQADQKGFAEIFVGDNDCVPNCADGGIVTSYYSWNGQAYVLAKCTRTSSGIATETFAPISGKCLSKT